MTLFMPAFTTPRYERRSRLLPHTVNVDGERLAFDTTRRLQTRVVKQHFARVEAASQRYSAGATTALPAPTPAPVRGFQTTVEFLPVHRRQLRTRKLIAR